MGIVESRHGHLVVFEEHMGAPHGNVLASLVIMAAPRAAHGGVLLHMASAFHMAALSTSSTTSTCVAGAGCLDFIPVVPVVSHRLAFT